MKARQRGLKTVRCIKWSVGDDEIFQQQDGLENCCDNSIRSFLYPYNRTTTIELLLGEGRGGGGTELFQFQIHVIKTVYYSSTTGRLL